jgi:nicotinamidase-related amidase
VRATAQDGFGYGYHVVMPREAVNSNYRHLHDASLEDIQRYMGEVVALEDAIAMLQGKI